MALNTFDSLLQDSAGNTVAVYSAGPDAGQPIRLYVFTDPNRINAVTTLYAMDGATVLPGYVTPTDDPGTVDHGRVHFKASDAYAALWLWDGNPASTPWLVWARETPGKVSSAISQAAAAITAAGEASSDVAGAVADAIAAQERSTEAETTAGQALSLAQQASDKVDAYTGQESGKKAVFLRQLPRKASGEWGYNFAPFCQDNVTSAGGVQYAAMWASDKKAYLYQRTLPDGNWVEVKELSTLASSKLGTVPADGHNVLAVAVDSNGEIHVAGNVHADPIKYLRSSTTDPTGAWTSPTMIGTQETQVSYPVFVTLGDGTLVFIFRDGTSGNADWYVNRYNAATRTWTRLGKLFDGKTSAESVYPNRFVPDDTNGLLVFYCWRGSGNADTNNDICFVRVRNLSGTMTVTRMDDTPVSLPVTHANSPKILDTAPTGSGLLNSHGADVDTLGRPHSVFWLTASAKTQLHHVYWTGDEWVVRPITQLSQAINLNVSTIVPTLSRAAVACDPYGGTHIIWRCNYDGRSGTTRATDVTPEREIVEYKLTDLEMYEWEPCLDSRALKERGEIQMLVGACTANGLDYDHTTEGWTSQWVGVLSVDLSRIGYVSSGSVRLPKTRIMRSQNGPAAGSTITATSLTDFGAGPIIVPDEAGRTFLARFSARVANSAASTETTVQIREQRELPTADSGYLGKMAHNATTAKVKDHPYVPLSRFGSAEGQRGWLVLYALKSGAGNGVVSIVNLELATIDEE